MKATVYYISAILIVFIFFTSGVKAQPKRLCVIGSSTAYAYFPSPSPAYPKDSGWVDKVKKYYQQYGTVDTVFNLGCIARNCYSGMPTGYIPPDGENNPDPNSNITKAISMVPKPDVIIINYPSNNYERLTNAEIIQCFQTMKDEANANGIRCYIATTQPRSSFDDEDRQKLKDLKDTMESVFGMWAIDFFTPLAEEPSLDILPALSLGDNIHINPAGHTELAKQVIAKDIFAIVLPVRLEYFHAKTVNHSTLLTWAATSDETNSVFRIERSNNGRNFESIAVMNGTNNSTRAKYQYTDRSANLGGFFYRLAAVSNDGKEQLSPVVFVPASNKIFAVSAVFPSPATNTIKTVIAVAGKQKIDILVTDVSGKPLLRQNILVNTSLQYQLNVSKFSAGNYYIRFSSNGRTETLPFCKL